MSDVQISEEHQDLPPKTFERDWFIVGINAIQTIATVAAVIFAVVSLSSTNRLQRELVEDQSVLQSQIAGNAAWASYIEWSAENTAFAIGPIGFRDANEDERQNKYMWQMERLLSASEDILNAYEGDIQWIDTFTAEVVLHPDYFLSDYFLDSKIEFGRKRLAFYCMYDPPVRDMIYEAFQQSVSAKRRLDTARADCANALKKRGQPNA